MRCMHVPKRHRLDRSWWKRVRPCSPFYACPVLMLRSNRSLPSFLQGNSLSICTAVLILLNLPSSIVSFLKIVNHCLQAVIATLHGLISTTSSGATARGLLVFRWNVW